MDNNISLASHAQGVFGKVKSTMFNMDDVIRLCLVALYSDGHVLLEANPGMGKTELVKRLGMALQLDFGRIQFTPDLMPADITGTLMPVRDGSNQHGLEFKAGPIFTQLLLADEINRATPKTQSAMLEAMAERQVTVLGETHKMYSPFMVLATQNPIDQEGTYDLPEAQSDRFMFKILVPVPDKKTLDAIMDKVAGPEKNAASSLRKKKTPEEYVDDFVLQEKYRRDIKQVTLAQPISTHIQNVVMASNQRFGENEVQGVKGGNLDELKQLSGFIKYGLGPRAAIALALGVKAWSKMFEDEGSGQYRALAMVVIPALRHRIIWITGWQDDYMVYRHIERPREGYPPGLLDRFLAEFFLAAAPTQGGKEYRQTLESKLSEIIGRV